MSSVAEQVVRHLAEVDDKVQRILYFVCNTGTEHSERCQLLLLLQLLLQDFNVMFHMLLVLQGW